MSFSQHPRFCPFTAARHICKGWNWVVLNRDSTRKGWALAVRPKTLADVPGSRLDDVCCLGRIGYPVEDR